MNTEVICVGIPAGWINGWLAGVGAAVLDPRICLHWTARGNAAVLSAREFDPLEALVESWPDKKTLLDLPIARHWRELGALRRNVAVDAFGTRARAARGHPQSWTLSSTMTDLCVDKSGNVQLAPFNVPVPKGLTLHDRLVAAHDNIPEPSSRRIRESFMGDAHRVQINGLGFDQARLGSQSDASDRWTDPVVEVLAFFGLALLPMRGRGSDGRLERIVFGDERQKGWRKPEDGSRSFYWPAWSQPLDAHGIDALLDVWDPESQRQWPCVGVHSAWRTVSFQAKDPKDPTRAFGAERL